MNPFCPAPLIDKVSSPPNARTILFYGVFFFLWHWLYLNIYSIISLHSYCTYTGLLFYSIDSISLFVFHLFSYSLISFSVSGQEWRNIYLSNKSKLGEHRLGIYRHRMTMSCDLKPLHGKYLEYLVFLVAECGTNSFGVPTCIVFDLPQLYTKPTATDILRALEQLAVRPRSFGNDDSNAQLVILQTGVSQYLTSIISSALSWIDSDELREAIWDAASTRLCERSGRTGKLILLCHYTI